MDKHTFDEWEEVFEDANCHLELTDKIYEYLDETHDFYYLRDKSAFDFVLLKFAKTEEEFFKVVDFCTNLKEKMNKAHESGQIIGSDELEQLSSNELNYIKFSKMLATHECVKSDNIDWTQLFRSAISDDAFEHLGFNDIFIIDLFKRLGIKKDYFDAMWSIGKDNIYCYHFSYGDINSYMTDAEELETFRYASKKRVENMKQQIDQLIDENEPEDR